MRRPSSPTSTRRLPAVSFIKPLGVDNEHPGYASLLAGQAHVASLVSAHQQSPEWRSTAVIITYDENGGRYDHVPPPAGDRWGPGVRVPAIAQYPLSGQIGLVQGCADFDHPAQRACYEWLGTALNVVDNGSFAKRGCPRLLYSATRKDCVTGADGYQGPLETFS